MKLDLTTVLGVTALLVIVVTMFRDPDGTARIINGLAEGYKTAVSPFLQ